MTPTKFELRAKQLAAELEAYKAAVHSLSFELEMVKDRSNRSITHKEIMLIREHALNQASEFVMDWGIPKSGEELVNMCDQIKKLNEKKADAIARGSEVAYEFFATEHTSGVKKL
jgi:hypothetical protein